MRPAHRGTPPGSDLSPCPLHCDARPAGPGAGEGGASRCWGPGAGEGSGDKADDVMDASPGLGGGGGRRGCGPDYVTSSLCAPPPGATRAGRELGKMREVFPAPQRPLGTSSGQLVARVSIYWRCGPWTAGEWRTPPLPCAKARVCARVCAGVGGALSAPSVLKHQLHQSQDLGDGSLPPLTPREGGSPLTHPNQEVLKTSAPQKPSSALSPLSPSALLPGSPS